MAAVALPPLRGRLHERALLAPYTSWRVGGPADILYEPADRDDLLQFLERQPASLPRLWIGLGSNLLVRDGGVRGVVLVLHGHLTELDLEPPGTISSGAVIHAEAGVHCARVAKFAERRNFSGLGFMNGIPGTVGGALAMNAGAFGTETWTRVVAAEALFEDGRKRWLQPAELEIAYRSVKPPPGFAGFLAARLRVDVDDGRQREETREAMRRRKATQPVGHASGGSTFRNPSGDHAARLIEAAGLKGFRVGGAQVSDRHANFIVNDGTATAADIEAVIKHMRTVVRENCGVVLQPEVRIVGEAVDSSGDGNA